MAGIGKYSHAKLVSIIKQNSDGVPVAGNPAGSNRQLQFNDNGSFGAVTSMIFDGNDLTISDDKKLHFGDGQDAHIEYNENGDDFLVISGSSEGIALSGSRIEMDGTLFFTDFKALSKPMLFVDDGVFKHTPGLQYDNYHDDLQIGGSTKLRFGPFGNTTPAIHLDNSFLTISGSSHGIVLSGSTIQIDGTLQGASPLKIGGALQFVGGDGAASAFNFGPNDEAKMFFQSSPSNALVISGSAANGGLTLSGSAINISSYVGIGVGEGNATHALTLPDNSNASGQVKANAFVSYSSIRYKENVQPLGSAVDTISKLQGVSYSWKDTGKKDFGFIAEEVGKVIPEIVEWSQDPQYANTMDYTRIISFLVEAVKEQQKKIDILSEKLDKLGL